MITASVTKPSTSFGQMPASSRAASTASTTIARRLRPERRTGGVSPMPTIAISRVISLPPESSLSPILLEPDPAAASSRLRGAGSSPWCFAAGHRRRRSECPSDACIRRVRGGRARKGRWQSAVHPCARRRRRAPRCRCHLVRHPTCARGARLRASRRDNRPCRSEGIHRKRCSEAAFLWGS